MGVVADDPVSLFVVNMVVLARKIAF